MEPRRRNDAGKPEAADAAPFITPIAADMAEKGPDDVEAVVDAVVVAVVVVVGAVVDGVVVDGAVVVGLVVAASEETGVLDDLDATAPSTISFSSNFAVSVEICAPTLSVSCCCSCCCCCCFCWRLCGKLALSGFMM